MKLAKIVSIVGVRPNFVKLAALHSLLSQNFDHIIVHTGQHYDYEMSRAFFDCLEIPSPKYDLDVGSGSPGFQFGEMWKRIENVLLIEKPDLVTVYGDANSTLAGALATAKLHMKIAHVEAGYRSYDKQMPEEVNRLLTDQISDFLFAPTSTAVENLRKENVRGKIYLTGDVMVDVLLKCTEIAEEKSEILEKLQLSPKEYMILTFHREKNTENIEVLRRLINALLSLKEFKIVLPIHPRTEKTLKKSGLLEELENSGNILIIPPLNYLDFVKLENNATKIITDSGGIQKEAYVIGKPCITLRDTTECIETVEEGWNLLVADDPEKIIDAVRNFAPPKESVRRALGDGKAADRIVDILKKDLELQ